MANSLILPLLISSLLLCLTTVTRAQSLSLEEIRRLVRKELQKANSSSDSILPPLLVRSQVEGSADYFLTPVLKSDTVVAFYRDEPRRAGVTVAARGVALRSVRVDLLTRNGTRGFLRSHGIEAEGMSLVSIGPLSAFGAAGVGWFVGTKNSYYLLSLTGNLIPKSQAEQYWPHKLEYLGKLESSIKHIAPLQLSPLRESVREKE